MPSCNRLTIFIVNVQKGSLGSLTICPKQGEEETNKQKERWLCRSGGGGKIRGRVSVCFLSGLPLTSHANFRPFKNMDKLGDTITV